MGNVKLIFCGDEETENTDKQMQIYINQFQKLYIEINDISDYTQGWDSLQYIVLDKQTAIKLSRELKKQIALMP
jgi:hypothetical protein